ncbi:type VI secretion system Vgr family protein [Geoalkalibacter sp.]|uniref:type VI secretion system Vgr family protein n=1 Tax=Geoalkalibacter sp. TaxID=3041440 RepID=UPI00272E32E5|nr:type VI secretion system tip protein TssI/VgrG [Geoalkalibacter sp.]
MLPSFHRARLHVQVGGLDFPALSLSGEDALSHPFCYRLDILVPEGFRPGGFLGLPARITLHGADGGTRGICGIATAFAQQAPHPDRRACFAVSVESALARLRLRRDTRIFLHQSLPEILLAVLGAHGIEAQRVRLRLSAHCPVRPWTLQVNESDLDFLDRLLAQAGIFYWSEADEDAEILVFADHNAHLPERQGAPLRYQPGGGLEPEGCGIRALRVRERLVTDFFEVQEKSLHQPAQTLRAQAQNSGQARRRAYRFAPGVAHLDEARQLARTAAEEEGARRLELHAQADVADLRCGQVLRLDATAFSPRYSGEYLIKALNLRLSQRAGLQAAGADLAFSCEVILIPRDTPYRPPRRERPEIPFTFSARIESSNLSASLDEQGRTQARSDFDQSGAAHGEASIPLRRLSPHAGPPGDLPCGLHTPLHDGAEVLMSCLNGDPDRPVLIGALPNPATPSPVTSANRSHNILRTAAGNQLLMDDTRESEVIRLSTFAGNNILELNAQALGERIRLAAAQGTLSLQARTTQRLQCGESLTEHSGNDRLHNIEQHQRTTTRGGEIHHQAHTDIRHQAAQAVQLQSGQNVELSSARHLRFDLERGQKLTVKGPEATFSVQNGDIHIQAAKGIDIQGRGGGDITFAQNGGGFIVTADGRVRIFGKTVSLSGQGGARLNGPTHFAITAPAPMPGVPAGKALRARGIATLRDQGSASIVNLAWGRKSVAVGESAELWFTVKNFRGGETAQVRVFERNADGAPRQIDTLHCLIDDGFGQYRLPWCRSMEQVRDDLLHDANAFDPRPLTYLFDVVVGDICSEYSPGLHLTTTLRFAPKDWEGRPLPEGLAYHLIDALGRRQSARIAGGELHFESVVLGPWQLLGAGDATFLRTQE